jgi:hypothetical protein
MVVSVTGSVQTLEDVAPSKSFPATVRVTRSLLIRLCAVLTKMESLPDPDVGADEKNDQSIRSL